MKTPLLAALRRRHQIAWWTEAVWIGAGGLGLALLARWLGLSAAIGAGVLGVTTVLILLSRFLRRRSLRDTVCALDAKLASANRLEAVAEMDGRADPLANGLREEAALFLSRRPLPRTYAWFSGVALLAVLAAVYFFAFGLADLRPVATAKTASTPATAEKSPEPAAPLVAPPASLRWLAPEPEITAAPGEHVPLTLEADSSTGLHRLTLQLTLNGEPQPAIALPDRIEAGLHPVALTLPLDTLRAEPFDIVTYHVTAERIQPEGANADWPAIASPLQLVQIRPLREEIANASGSGSGDDQVRALLNRIRDLKFAQQALLKTTFALDHGAPSRVDPSWREQTRATEIDQTSLAEETAPAAQEAGSASVPGEVAEALDAARKEMLLAVDELSRDELARATASEGRALARLATAEKIVAQLIRRARSDAPQDETSLKAMQSANLPERGETPVGRLEKLARDQRRVADQLTRGTVAASAAADQDQLAREIAVLSNERAFSSELNTALQTAADSASEAAKQLIEQDVPAATEPALRAAQLLEESLAKIDATGRAESAAVLAAAQRQLIRAATDVQTATSAETRPAAQQATRETTTTQRELEAAANRQQQQGSSEAAQQLSDLARAIANSGALPDLEALARAADAATPTQKQTAGQKLVELAQKAADANGNMGGDQSAEARATENLRRAQANLERAAAAGPEAMKDLYENALADVQSVRGALGPAATLPPPGSGGRADSWHSYSRELAPRLEGIVRLLADAAREAPRQQVLTTANPSEAPPAYRPAVADYFESLARDSTAQPAQRP